MKVLNSTAVELSWRIPQQQSYDYSVFYLLIPTNILTKENISLSHDSNTTHVVVGLLPFTWYSFRVVAEPETHVSTDEVVVRTHEDGKTFCCCIYV